MDDKTFLHVLDTLEEVFTLMEDAQRFDWEDRYQEAYAKLTDLYKDLYAITDLGFLAYMRKNQQAQAEKNS